MSASTKDLFALTEGILAQKAPVKELSTAKVDPIVDDGIKDVIVPSTFVNQIVGFSNALSESSDPDKKQDLMPEFEPITEATILKDRLEALVESLKNLLREAKDVMEEMTTTGMIGINLAPEKKNGPRKRNKRNKSK
tara:strand:+ start:120 stop:530 length:411 start_codon:yes stop_codon:yes gene_type:complete